MSVNSREWREEEVMKMLPQIERYAKFTYRYLSPSMSYEDLVQEGANAAFIGLLKYDATRGYKPVTYVWRRVVGAMQDYIRRHRFHLKRSGRHKGWDRTESLEKKMYERDSGIAMTRRDVIVDDHDDLSHVNRDDEWDDVLKRFAKRERKVLTLYFRQDKTMREIGREVGLSESRISQMMKTLLIRIKNEVDLRGAFADERVPGHRRVMARSDSGCEDDGD